jgi:HAMP domain-containing protein
MRGVASVETSLAPAIAHRAAVLRRTAMMVLALTVVGGLVSMLISTVITRDIGRLTRTAEAFAGGTYDARLAGGAIEEVAVVGATLGIMGSVLEDTRLRATREMLQFDRVNPDQALAAAYAERFARPVVGAFDGVRLAIDRLGAPTHGDFWLVSRRGGTRACLGRVEAETSFDAVLAASAAAALIEEGLGRGEAVEAVLAATTAIVPLHCAIVLEWTGSTRPLAVHRLQAGEAPTREELTPGPGETVAVTTLDRESDRRTARYAGAHAFDSPERCLEELHRFFGGGTDGGVLVLQREAR